jgi:hypothetical protein
MTVPPSRRFLTLTAAILAVAMLPVASAGAASPGSFSARPAQFDPRDPATRAYFKIIEPAGGAFTRQVLIANTGTRALRLLVHSVDGLTGVTSGAVYGNAEDRLSRAGRWLKPAVHAITVAPHSTRRVSFTVSVPRRAAPGDHLAGIAFEDAAPTVTPGRFSVKQMYRIVIGVEVRVPGPAASQIQLTSAAVKPLPGTSHASIVIGLRNAGSLLCKPWLTVQLQGAGRPRVLTSQLDTVLPGDAIPYPLPWKAALTPGRYRIRIAASQCGTSRRLVATINSAHRLLGEKGSSAPLQPADVGPSPGTPWWLIALVGVGGLAAGAVLAYVGFVVRRRRDQAARPDVTPAA